MDGIEQLICCSVEGEMRGYKSTVLRVNNSTDSTEASGSDSERNSATVAASQEAIRNMVHRKHNLSLEMSHLEEATKSSSLNALSASFTTITSNQLSADENGSTNDATYSQPTRIPVSSIKGTTMC